MKKFYRLASHAAEAEGFSIRLDGKPMKTPAGNLLRAPAPMLAQAVAAEWAAQGTVIAPETMPLTQLLTMMIDHVSGDRAAMAGKLLAYLDTDLLCYRAQLPADLAALQVQRWDPWLSWFAKTHGAALETTSGLKALRQSAQARKAAAGAAERLGQAAFTVLQMAVPLTGSLVLGLAFVAGAASPEQVYEAANAEEDYKAQVYNEAEHGAAPQQEQRQQAMRLDLEAAKKFLELSET